MKTYLLLITNFIFFLGFSQNLAFYELPVPQEISFNYPHADDSETILYGAIPANFNGKVLIFNHGYTATSSSLLVGNTFYKEAYDAGYKTAFVSTTRTKGDWVNGEILGRAINQILQYFQAKSADLIVHSNGGKASEVAVFFHENQDLIDKIISLGTPFRGTQLADLNQISPLTWLEEITDYDIGSGLSTTYYCDLYFRPFLDNLPNNQPKKYYNLGAWGYDSFRGIYSGILLLSGSILKGLGGGTNDGITPYYSSSRPGGTIIAAVGEKENFFNHIDIMYGQNVWNNFVYPVLTGKIGPNYVATNLLNTKNIDNSYRVKSNSQFLFSEQQEQPAIIPATSTTMINLIQADKNSIINVLNTESHAIIEKIEKNPTENFSRLFFNQAVKSFKLQSQSPYFALVKDELDKPMVYTFTNKNDTSTIEISFPNSTPDELQSIILTAKIRRLSDLKGIETDHSTSKNISFIKNGSTFISNVSNNQTGIYSLFVEAKIPEKYRRNIISGFIINDNLSKKTSSTKGLIEKAQNTSFILSNNPVNTNSTLYIPTNFKDPLSCEIVSFEGYPIKSFSLDYLPNNNFVKIGHHFNNLKSGYYLLRILSKNKEQTTIKFIKK